MRAEVYSLRERLTSVDLTLGNTPLGMDRLVGQRTDQQRERPNRGQVRRFAKRVASTGSASD